MSKLPENILQAGCTAYAKEFLHGNGTFGEGIEAAYFAINEHEGWVRAEPKAWDGEGLPPVGVVCEFAGFNPEETLPSDPMVGDQVTVIAHFKSGFVDVAAFTFYAPPEFQALQVAQGAYGCFRPIRTPGQIAQQEREAAIDEMDAVFSSNFEGHRKDGLQALYDAGYRKQPVR